MSEKLKSYRIIATIKDESQESGKKWVKYHSPDLLSFQLFLDKEYPEWLWFNVYDGKGVQIANYTKNKRATCKRVP